MMWTLLAPMSTASRKASLGPPSCIDDGNERRTVPTDPAAPPEARLEMETRLWRAALLAENIAQTEVSAGRNNWPLRASQVYDLRGVRALALGGWCFS